MENKTILENTCRKLLHTHTEPIMHGIKDTETIHNIIDSEKQ